MASAVAASKPTTTSRNQAKQQLSDLVKILLGRVYQDGISRILNIDVEANSDITGYFQDQLKIIKFLITADGTIKYHLLQHTDSWIQGYARALPEVREDASRKNKPNCKIGISCGKACISANKTCEVQLSRITTPNERSRLQAVKLGVSAPTVESSTSVPPEDLESKSIRELKKQAADAGVYRYSYMTTSELRQAIRTIGQNPEQQERVRKTLERKQQKRKAINSLAPSKLVKIWKDLDRISRTAGSSPETAGILAATFLMGVGAGVAQRVRDRYQNGLDESAQIAFQRASNLPTDSTGKANIMFAVGGFAGIGSNGQRIQDLLEAPQDGTKGEEWFRKNNHIVPFNHKEFDIPDTATSKRNPDGSYNPAYLGYVAQASFGKYLQNLRRGRNEAAVDLAAQMYAYGDRYKKSGINVLGHGVGGNVAREATEILSKMRSPDDKRVNGADILKRVSVVNLGTPYFGFTNSKIWNSVRNRTITSSGDPFSILPKKMPQWISTVKGHEPDDYLKDREVRDRLREAFGYYSSSILGRQQARERNKEVRSSIGEALNVAYPPAGRVWNQLSKIYDKAGDNRVAASIYTGAVLTGVGAATYKYQQKRHASVIAKYADEAKIMSDDLTVPHVSKSSVMFTVGGAGATAGEISELVKQNPELLGRNQVIPFDTSGGTPLKSGGIDPNSAQYLGYVAQEEYGGVLKRALQNRNPDAVRLAAQLYAYASSTFQQNQGEAKYLPINLLGYGGGGVTAREAMEIFRAMPDGKALAEHIRLVNLSTPSFGLVSDKVKERNFISTNDPFKILPQPNDGARSTVEVNSPDRTAQSYLQNPQVIQGIATTFNEKREFATRGRVVAENNRRQREREQADAAKKKQQAVDEKQRQAELQKQQQEAERARKATERAQKKEEQRKNREAAKSTRVMPNLPQWMSIENTGSDDPRKQPGWNELPEDMAARQLLKYKRYLERKRREAREAGKATEEVRRSRTGGGF